MYFNEVTCLECFGLRWIEKYFFREKLKKSFLPKSGYSLTAEKTKKSGALFKSGTWLTIMCAYFQKGNLSSSSSLAAKSSAAMQLACGLPL